jgi:hypothetical protein
MSLPDKFGVLITSNRSVLKKSDTRDIECYFENTIKNNNRIFLSDYITRQIDNHNAEDINKIILNYLNDFIKQIRKNLRTNIRRSKNLNIVESFIKLLNIFGNKIYELEYFSKDPKFKKLCYNQFFSTVVSDPMIQVIFTSDVMNQELKSKVKNLFLKIKKCDPIFYDEWCLSFISKCITEFNKSCLCDNYPIPKNIEAVYNFKNLSKFINTYSKHFNFLNTPVIFDKSNCDLMDTFIEISQLNNQDAFNIFLKQKDTIENVIKAYEILDSKKKDEVQMSMVLNIIENYKNVKSLLSLCQIYITISKYYYKIFDSTSILLNKEIAKIICKNSLYQDLNNILIDMVQSDFCEDVTYLFSVIGNLDDKNICFKRYHQELMLRLSKQYEESDIKKVIAYENSLVHKLTKCFTGSQRYKLKKTIKDVDESAEFNKNIREEISKTHHDSCKNLPGNFNIINTSYNIWDTNVLDIATRIDNIDDTILRNLSGPLLKFIRMYSKCFLVRTKSKEYLNWYFHTGSVSLNYQSNNGKICLKMLPIQAIILELFNDKDIININEILNHIILNSYDRKEKEKILDIFINFSILKLNYEKVEFNMDIPASSSEINIIEPFFEVSSLPTKWEEEKEIELANNKVDIVKTKINHYLKKSTQTKEDLFKLCKTINVFSLDEEVFDKAIKSMVDQEYIEYNDQDSTYLKLLY